MMVPRRAASIAGSTARQHRKTPRRLTATVSSHSEVLASATGPKAATPAAVTRQSMRPEVLSVSLTSAATAASSLTSVGRTTALPPAASISRWTAVSSCADLAQRATTAPSRAKAWATARPMPRPAPVTTTTCPASPPSSDELK